MKKLLTVFVTCCCLLTLVACGSEKKEEKKNLSTYVLETVLDGSPYGEKQKLEFIFDESAEELKTFKFIVTTTYEDVPEGEEAPFMSKGEIKDLKSITQAMGGECTVEIDKKNNKMVQSSDYKEIKESLQSIYSVNIEKKTTDFVKNLTDMGYEKK
ncbi:MAG: hypothetical protein EOM50_06205 [Erysipelotrichia bacterium]|nr:hypothetical protein [Erysipelotrichia bacterium]